jgi:hypothetical protein
MNVLYYNYYLFITRGGKEDQPHATVIFALSFSESLLVNYAIEFVGVHLLCKFLLDTWSMIVIFGLILLANYTYFVRTGRNIKIIERRPKFFNNSKASAIITITFILITTSFLFWMADYLMWVLDKC